MILILYLFLPTKSDLSTRFQRTYNESVACDVLFSFSNSLFHNIDVPIIENSCEQKSISFSYCVFSEIECIINPNYGSLNNFSFDHNCCYNNGIKTSQSYISISSNVVQFKWNTLSTFAGNDISNFIFFDSSKIYITNLNLTNNNDFTNSISIKNPQNELQFNDVTFYNEVSKCHINIAGPPNKNSTDRINDNGNDGICFMRLRNNIRLVVTRVHMERRMSIDIEDGYIWFVDSQITGYPTIGLGTPKNGSIVIDYTSTYTNSYFINHLSVQECPTNNIQLDDPPPHTVGKSMKVKLSFAVIGGILFGVVVFLILYFVIKYSIKCYQKKKDQEHPVFDL